MSAGATHSRPRAHPFGSAIAPISSGARTRPVQRAQSFDPRPSPLRSSGRTHLVQHHHPFGPARSPIWSNAITHLRNRCLTRSCAAALDKIAGPSCCLIRTSATPGFWRRKVRRATPRSLSLIVARVESSLRDDAGGGRQGAARGGGSPYDRGGEWCTRVRERVTSTRELEPGPRES